MEDLAPRIVKKAIALGCQDAVAEIVTNRSYQIRFAQNEAVISNRWRELTASVFFVYKKRVLASDINYVILAETGISTVPTSAVTGNVAVSPAAASYITGFALIADPTNAAIFRTCSLYLSCQVSCSEKPNLAECGAHLPTFAEIE